ncbi:MAG: sterol desaturase family protein [Bdellovibrionales bacterium]|nr:sterol desaturase family protein [Bdellovibrionales bacterium]
MILSVLFGVLTWPVLEYALHRFLGHVWRRDTLFRREHLRHHREKDYFATAGYKIAAAVPAVLVFWGIGTLATASARFGAAYAAGATSMVAFYEWFHWRCHARAPLTALGLRLRKHHFHHHFRNAKSNFGVTGTWMDRLLGTYAPTSVVGIPRDFRCEWLFDANGTTIAEAYAGHFALAGTERNGVSSGRDRDPGP